MRGDKKTAPEGISFRDGEQLTMDIGQPLSIHFTAEPGTIASFLRRGRVNAVKAAELCRITGWPFRVVTRRVQIERLQGAPILSSPGCGYWLASDAAEVIRCADALQMRAKTQHATAAALRGIVR